MQFLCVIFFFVIASLYWDTAGECEGSDNQLVSRMKRERCRSNQLDYLDSPRDDDPTSGSHWACPRPMEKRGSLFPYLEVLKTQTPQTLTAIKISVWTKKGRIRKWYIIHLQIRRCTLRNEQMLLECWELETISLGRCNAKGKVADSLKSIVGLFDILWEPSFDGLCLHATRGCFLHSDTPDLGMMFLKRLRHLRPHFLEALVISNSICKPEVRLAEQTSKQPPCGPMAQKLSLWFPATSFWMTSLAQTGCQQSVFGSGGVPTAWKLVVSHAEHSFLLCERIFSRRLAWSG